MNRSHQNRPFRPSRERGEEPRRMEFGGPSAQRGRGGDLGRREAMEDDRYPHGYSGARHDEPRASGDWDEDRYGYPEATSYGREMDRARDDYRPEGRFAEHDYDTDADLFRGGRESAGRGGYGEGGYGIPAERDPARGGGSWRYHSHGNYRGSGRSERRGSGEGPYAGGSEAFRGQGVFGSMPPRRYGGQMPKGYTRSDERIRDDVCEHLYHADDVDVAEVSIEVREGTVTLEGTVPERRMKHRIEDIAEQCFGVVDVDNRIRVGPGGREQPVDTGVDENPGEARNDRSRPRRSGGSATGITSPRH